MSRSPATVATRYARTGPVQVPIIFGRERNWATVKAPYRTCRALKHVGKTRTSNHDHRAGVFSTQCAPSEVLSPRIVSQGAVNSIE